MKTFSYERAESVEAAAARAVDPGVKLIAGGTNLLDLMKLGVEAPAHLVDIGRLPLRDIGETADGGISLGALATNAVVAHHPRIRAEYPVLARAILAGASPQLRNKATVGGNLLQRTRCPFFQDRSKPCNKRKPGSGCAAIGSQSRAGAVLGASEACIATHPSDMAVALTALGAIVATADATGARRRRPIVDLYRLPGGRPDLDTTLGRGEIVTGVELPPPPTGRQVFEKARDRASFAFAVVSVAVVGQATGEIRAVLGGVAHRPWLAEAAAATLARDGSAQEAAEAELAPARAHGGNDFKITLARRMLAAALVDAQVTQ